MILKIAAIAMLAVNFALIILGWAIPKHSYLVGLGIMLLSSTFIGIIIAFAADQNRTIPDRHRGRGRIRMH